ncbi:hypothetical protein ACFQHP_01525 [Halomicroarcula sp. GCM10025743]
MNRFHKGNLVLSEETYRRVEPILARVARHAGKLNIQAIGSGLTELLDVDVKELQGLKLPIVLGACVACVALWCKNRLLQGREEDIELPVYDGDKFETKNAATLSIIKGQKEQFE